eukprot:366476-Chlamydomonas_euryale.AAC.15
MLLDHKHCRKNAVSAALPCSVSAAQPSSVGSSPHSASHPAIPTNHAYTHVQNVHIDTYTYVQNLHTYVQKRQGEGKYLAARRSGAVHTASRTRENFAAWQRMLPANTKCRMEATLQGVELPSADVARVLKSHGAPQRCCRTSHGLLPGSAPRVAPPCVAPHPAVAGLQTWQHQPTWPDSATCAPRSHRMTPLNGPQPIDQRLMQLERLFISG